MRGILIVALWVMASALIVADLIFTHPFEFDGAAAQPVVVFAQGPAASAPATTNRQSMIATRGLVSEPVPAVRQAARPLSSFAFDGPLSGAVN